MTRFRSTIVVLGCLALLATPALADEQEGPTTTSTTGPPSTTTTTAPVVHPMIYPVIGRTEYADTFGFARQGGIRRHQGQDLMSAKMSPLVAVADGVLTKVTIPEPYWGRAVTLLADDGWEYRYIHMNNDSLGTDDGKAPLDLVFGPGIRQGVHVQAGQLVGYVGDSGNAENTAPHVHFEMRAPGARLVNGYRSLRAAVILAAPVGLPAGFELPLLRTSRATPRPRPASSCSGPTTASSSSSSSSSTSTSSSPTTAEASESTTSTTTRPCTTSTTARKKPTTTTTRRTTSTTRKPSTTSTTRKTTSTTHAPSTTSTTRKPTTTTTAHPTTTTSSRPTTSTTR